MMRPHRPTWLDSGRIWLFLTAVAAIVAGAVLLSSCAVSLPIGESGKYGSVSVAYKLPEQGTYGGGK